MLAEAIGWQTTPNAALADPSAMAALATSLNERHSAAKEVSEALRTKPQPRPQPSPHNHA